MGLPEHTSTEKPSTSETHVEPKDSQTTTFTSSGPTQGTKSEAELAAEKVYEERMEEEYAKREGGA
jgi:hypothetical protein